MWFLTNSGPVGVGKSYLLYLLAADFRSRHETYRVTYINDCAAWKNKRFIYLLREFVTTFFDDDIDGDTIVNLCKRVTESDKEEKMMTLMIDSLIAFTRKKKLQWIVICDQHNAFYSRTVVVDQFPFNIISQLSSERGDK